MTYKSVKMDIPKGTFPPVTESMWQRLDAALQNEPDNGFRGLLEDRKFTCVHMGRSTWQGYIDEMPEHVRRWLLWEAWK